MGHYLHPQGLCETSQVGDGTRIWAFAHVLPGASIGRDCNLNDHVFVEGDVVERVVDALEERRPGRVVVVLLVAAPAPALGLSLCLCLCLCSCCGC